MPEMNQTRGRSSAFWWGLIIVLLAVASNFLYWLRVPQRLIPWINLILPAIGLLLIIIGLKRLWPSGRLWAKILGIVVTLVSATVFAFSVWLFVHVRDVPGPAGAPKVGQKVPDFSLADTSGRSVSLTELLTNPMENASRPKAVLLIFYRGYW